MGWRQTELKPGEYEVKVDGDKVTFKQGKNVIAVAAKVETNASKFSDTQMDIKTENGQAKLKELDLGGTKSKIMLTDASAVEARYPLTKSDTYFAPDRSLKEAQTRLRLLLPALRHPTFHSHRPRSPHIASHPCLQR